MKKIIVLSLLIILVACKKKETKSDPEPQPTTTGPAQTSNTVKVVYVPSASFGVLSIKWEYDYNTLTADSFYTNPSAITKTQLVQGDSIKISWLCHTTAAGGNVANANVDVYVNNVLKKSYQSPGQDEYIKIK